MNAKLSTLAIIAALFSVSSYASDPVTINVTGKVVASPCTFDTANSSLNIDLGEKGAADMVNPVSTLPEKPFNLVMKDCPAGTTNVIATFSGTDAADLTNGNAFKNMGTATNMVIQVKPKNGNWDAVSFKNGSTLTLPVNTTEKKAYFALATRAITWTGGVSPGTVSASIVVDFTYQ